ncbi:hypothetical protein LPJ64_002216 [Coemansia asiatica]|uniref:Uncharacterized protein n=1 Tax=Coemansia asiatica TaxID=1052880 RepID=A0A9W7XNJ1_9FUNG|nr:hypothetical protein LPJ64_002216 [Coemansia asiatica]
MGTSMQSQDQYIIQAALIQQLLLCSVNHMTSSDNNLQKIDVASTDQLLLNASHAFIKETLGLIAQWGDEMENHQQHKQHQKLDNKPIGKQMPYVLINQTGIDCHASVNLPEGAIACTEHIDMMPVLLCNDESLPWHFEDSHRAWLQSLLAYSCGYIYV